MDSNAPVCEIMRQHFATVDANESLHEAHRLMCAGRLRHLVVTRDGFLVGVLSYRDLQELMDASGRRPVREGALDELCAAEAVGKPPAFVRQETPLGEAWRRLDCRRVGCLPVVDPSPGGLRLVGLITESDLLRAAYDPYFRPASSDV